MAKIKTPDGLVHNVKTMDFKPINEHITEYLLDDGTKIQIRSTLIDVKKSDKFNPDGEPIYFPSIQQSWRILVDEKLLKEPTTVHTQIGPEQQQEPPGGYR